MAIWVDADACPNVIKEILFRAAERTQTSLTLVANQPLRVPPSRVIRTLRVPQGFDVADNEIVRLCEPGDLVITADIPLAAEVLAKGGAALKQLEAERTPLYEAASTVVLENYGTLTAAVDKAVQLFEADERL